MYWRLKRPLCGLKTAPKNWQDYFADILISLGGKRLKSDANVYYFPEIENYVMVYVDDLLILGENPQPLFDLIQGQVRLRPIGELTEGGPSVKFLGRRLRRQGVSIEILPRENYIEEILIKHGLENCKSLSNPGVATQKILSGVSQLSGT